MGWFRTAMNKEPAMMIAAIIAAGAVSIPFVVVPFRRSLGKPTYQWDSDVENHPLLNYFGDNYKLQRFDDASKLAAWSQHQPYKYLGRLTPKSHEERDFPEARARLEHKLW